VLYAYCMCMPTRKPTPIPQWEKQRDGLYTKVVGKTRCSFEHSAIGARWYFAVADCILDEIAGVIDDPPFGELENSELKYFLNGQVVTRKGPMVAQVLTSVGWKDRY